MRQNREMKIGNKVVGGNRTLPRKEKTIKELLAQETVSAGELGRLIHLPYSTVRDWTVKGLLVCEPTTTGGRRKNNRYNTEKTLARFAEILYEKVHNRFTINEIRSCLKAWENLGRPKTVDYDPETGEWTF